MIDISHLPKSMQRRPEVKALSLKVYPGDGPKHFRVPGSEEIHDVYLFGGQFQCSCRAATSGRVCSHSIAAKNYCQHQEKT